MELELASEGHQGAHRYGGAPRGAPPTLVSRGVGPLVFIFCKDFLYFPKRCSVKFQFIPRTFVSAHK